MAAYVIQILELAGIASHRGPIAQEGEFVKTFDPDAFDGRGDLTTTPDLADALRFETSYAAMEFWRQQSMVAPIRMDGKPNRPLTAFTVTIARSSTFDRAASAILKETP
jgi:hypothetical protein